MSAKPYICSQFYTHLVPMRGILRNVAHVGPTKYLVGLEGPARARNRPMWEILAQKLQINIMWVPFTKARRDRPTAVHGVYHWFLSHVGCRLNTAAVCFYLVLVVSQ